MKGKLYDSEFYQSSSELSRSSARAVLGLLFELFRPASVVDFGCGAGTWLAVAGELGASELKGYDGAWVTPDLISSKGKSFEFEPADLENPPLVSRRYELAISVEVAEHLSPTSAEKLVHAVARASDVVLFSAAVPLQGGVSHVNERPQSYWVSQFESVGYKCFDCIRGALWEREDVAWWYRQNVLLYVKEEALGEVISEQALRERERRIFDIRHPEPYERAACKLAQVRRPSLRFGMRMMRRAIFGRRRQG